jgi:tetratricopeptide (TPR) repeat protein
MNSRIVSAGILVLLAAAGAAPGQDPPAAAPPSRAEMAGQFQEGAFLLAVGKHEEAVAKFSKALEGDPAEFTLLFFRANAYAKLGKKAEALADLKKLVETGGLAGYWAFESDPTVQTLKAEPAIKEILKNRAKAIKGVNAAREKRIQALGGSSWAILKPDKAPYWIVSDADPAKRDPFADLVRKMTAGLSRDLFKVKPEYTVLVFVASSMEAFTKAFGPAWGTPGTFGSLQAAVSVEAGGPDCVAQLSREYCRALHHLDMEAARQSHPYWVFEGLSRMYEDVRFDETTGEALGAFDVKLNAAFQDLLQKQPERCLAWKDLMDAATAVYGDRKTQMVAAVSVKYLFLFLQEKGALEIFYKALRKRLKEDPAGIKALEEAMGGKKAADLETEWKEWILGLKRE